MNSDDAWGAANRMRDAANTMSRAADTIENAAQKISYLLEDGYGGNGVRLIELLENLNITKAVEAEQNEAVQADLLRDAERYCHTDASFVRSIQLTDSYRLNSDKSVAISNDFKMSKAMVDCPRGVKVLLLGAGGVLVMGNYAGESFWLEWCALPSRAD